MIAFPGRSAVASLALLLSGCLSNEHLVFFTNTTIGVELAAEPQTGNPAKFVVGYKRQEGVIDPLNNGRELVEPGGQEVKPKATPEVFHPSRGIVATRHGYFVPRGVRAEPHSVIAKLNFGATASKGAGTTAAQWFATGQAAILLASHPDAAAAVTGDPRVGATTRQIALSANAGLRDIATLNRIYGDVVGAAGGTSENAVRAQELKAKVASVDRGEFREPFTRFEVTSGPPPALTRDTYPASASAALDFQNVLDYVAALSLSIDAGSSAAADAGTVAAGTNAALTSAERQALFDDLAALMDRRTRLLAALGANDDVHELTRFWFDRVFYAPAE